MKIISAILLLFCSTHSLGQIEVSIDDSLMYDSDFLMKIRSNEYFKNTCKSIELLEGKMILNRNDTIHFPNELEIGKVNQFVGNNGSADISLSIKRINYTSIEFNFEFIQNKEVLYSKDGVASIIPYFFFGSESDEFEGVLYLIDEYKLRDDDCYYTIGIGMPQKGITLASFDSDCLEKTLNLDSKELPKLFLK